VDVRRRLQDQLRIQFFLIKESIKMKAPLILLSILVLMAVIVMILSVLSVILSFFPDLLLFLF